MILYDQNIWNYNPCHYRNKLIRELVTDFNADVCTFQECGPATNRVGDAPIPVLMSDEYTEVCPELAHKNFTPVFYKTEKYNLIDSGYLLYDGINDCDSKGVTWAVLEDKETSKRIAVASTHFYWQPGKEEYNQQRLQNAEQLKEVCESIIAKYDVPVIIGGDFNNGTNAEQGDEPYHKMLKDGFIDIRKSADETTDMLTHHEYPTLTDNGVYTKAPMPKITLDHIFIYGNSGIKAKKFDVITSEKALCSSDHCPLIGIFEI